MRLLIIFCFLWIFNLTAICQDKTAILGTWYNQEKTSKILIHEDKDKKIWGKIVWLQEPIDPDTRLPKTDKNNPNKTEAIKPLLNLYVLRNFSFIEEGVWENGKIYDPKNGKIYSCNIKMDKNNQNVLNIRGYLGVSLIGRTAIWTRSE